MNDLYLSKSKAYYTSVRTDLVSMVIGNPLQKILEIGAGGGETLCYIKENKIAQEVVGVDLFAIEGTSQKNVLIDCFLIKDIEKEDIDYPEGYFDVILCGDVVEHLSDPWTVIKKLSFYLKNDGRLIISTPNFRNWRNFVTIFLKGRFLYNPAGGLLDKTHLRFFCKKDIIELVSTDSLSCTSIMPINYFIDYQFSLPVRWFNIITFKVFEEFLAYQYIVVGTKAQP